MDLASWGVTNLEVLCSHHGKQHKVDGKNLGPLINSDLVKHEFFSFKIQCTTEWMDKNFRDVWVMITWNPDLRGKYANLLILAEIARVQYISTTACERAFSAQNCIKSEFRNRLQTQHLESVLRNVLEGPKEGSQDGCDSLLMEAIGLWKKSTKFRYL
jgi:hypothetical protein